MSTKGVPTTFIGLAGHCGRAIITNITSVHHGCAFEMVSYISLVLLLYYCYFLPQIPLLHILGNIILVAKEISNIMNTL